MKINTSRKAGFTLVEIMIVVAIIGLLAAIAIPNFVKARQTSQTNACINNLRQIDGAVQQLLLETPGATIDATTVGEYIKGGIPECPATGTAYSTFGDGIATSPVCPTAVADHVLPGAAVAPPAP
jgi:prepilin-type N-terminal cleavage/methylation domain-containing protein